MEYQTALSIAAKAIQKLTDLEGSMSQTEVILHVSALDLSLRSIAQHNEVILPANAPVTDPDKSIAESRDRIGRLLADAKSAPDWCEADAWGRYWRERDRHARLLDRRDGLPLKN